MTTKRLIEMYEAGFITGYQVMMDCLMVLDPDNPDLVLAELPEEILDELLAYAQRYDSSRAWSGSTPPPAEIQIRTAARWVLACRTIGYPPLLKDTLR